MSLYVSIAFSNEVKTHYEKAFNILNNCLKVNYHYCAYIAGFYYNKAYRDYEHLSRLPLDIHSVGALSNPSLFLSSLALPCEEFATILGQATTDLAAVQFNKKGKKAYSSSNFEKALVYFTMGYVIGSLDSVRSLQYMLNTNKISGPFSTPLPQTLFTLRAAIQVTTPTSYLYLIADSVLQGITLNNKPLEKNDNAYSLYSLAQKFNADRYVEYSLAYMTDRGLGTAKNTTLALQLYWDILEKSLKGGASSLFFPTLLQVCRLKILTFVHSWPFSLFFKL